MYNKEYLLYVEKFPLKEIHLDDIICNSRNYLNKHFSQIKYPYRAHSILESRFIPTEVSFKIGMKSCGSLTNIITEMLRHR